MPSAEPGTAPAFSGPRRAAPNRRGLLRSAAALVGPWLPGLSLLPAGAAAQAAFPERPVRLIVPFAPGGGVDIVARLLAEPMRAALGQPVVVENRGGAGGQLGAQAAARAAPDGHTILLASAGEIAAAPALYGARLPYDPVRDLVPITLVVRVPNLLAVTASLPVHTAGELVALARRRPGALSYASSGVGNLQHLNGELFDRLAGVRTAHVPYRGTGSTLADVAAGRVSMTYAGAPALLPLIRDGQLRPIGVSSATRMTVLPSVPALGETAELEGYDLVNWYGLFAPAGTPPEAVARLHEAAVAALRDPDLIRKLAEQGTEAAPTTPEAFRDFVAAETASLGRLVRDAGITPDN